MREGEREREREARTESAVWQRFAGAHFTLDVRCSGNARSMRICPSTACSIRARSTPAPSAGLSVERSRTQNSHTVRRELTHTQVIVRSERKQRRERKDNFVSFRKKQRPLINPKS